MAVKWGFGVEKETAFVGYNKGLKNITSKTRSNGSVRYSHDEDDLVSLGDYASETTDITVYNGSGSGSSGVEIITKNKHLKDKPKDNILGFIKDTEKRAKEYIVAQRQVKRTIPFGSIPDVSSDEMRNKVAGSYHLNVTFPYENNVTDNDDYKNKLKRGLMCVRAIQPLIMAMVGGADSKVVGNPNHLEGSLRQVYTSGTSGIGYARLGSNQHDSIFNAIDSKYGNANRDESGNRGGPGFERRVDDNPQAWRGELRTEFPEVGTASFTDFRIKGFRGIPVPTIEYRFLDTFDTRGLYDVFRVVCLAMANGSRVNSFGDAGRLKVWNDAMKEIAKEGWNAYLDKDYVEFLKKNLKLDSLKIETSKIRADILLMKVIDELWINNKEDVWVKSWTDEGLPTIHNFNKDSWEFYFLEKIKSSSVLKDKLMDFLNIIGNIKANSSNGWIKVNWKGNKYSVRDIIIDENVMGSDYGFEDTEDILHFLHRYNIIDIREDKSGRIVDIKKNFSNENELNKKIKAMIDEEDMLNGEDGLLSSDEVARFDSSVSEPIERPTPTSRPIERPAPMEEQTGRMMIEVYTPSDEEIELNADDMEQVFQGANLKFNGRRLNVRVKYARLRLNGNTFPFGYWEYMNGIVKLYVPPVFESMVNLSSWVQYWKNNKLWTKEGSRIVSKVPYDGYPVDFFALLEAEALNEYSKSETITLDRAGVNKLKNHGISLLSFKRGQKYKIANKVEFARIMNSPNRIHTKEINYIPYQRGYTVKKQGRIFTLMNGNTKINSVEGGN